AVPCRFAAVRMDSPLRTATDAARESRRSESEQPAAALLHDLAVAEKLPARTQVFDHVPVDDAVVLAAELGEAGADREMDGAVDLLVEERVPHVPLDPGVAADPQLAEDARALVAVECLEQDVFSAGGRGLDDATAAVDHPHALDLVRLLERRELREVDDALRRVLHRAGINLAASARRVCGVRH